MFHPPSDADDGVPLEFVADQRGYGAVETDVFFGRTHRPEAVESRRAPAHRRRATWWVALGAVAALAVGGFVLGENRHTQRSLPPPTAPDAKVAVSATFGTATSLALGTQPSTRASTPITATATAGSASPATTSSSGVGPLLVNDHNWGLFIFNPAGQGSEVRRIDLATGAVTHPDGVLLAPGLGLIGSGAAARALTTADVGSIDPQTAPGPDGTVWVGSDRAHGSVGPLSLIRPDQGAGRTVVRTIQPRTLGNQYTSLGGSTAEGDPVLVGPDGSPFALNPSTYIFHRLSAGTLVGTVSRGNFATVECDESGVCKLVLHGGATTASVPFSGGQTASLSPDGSHALVFVPNPGDDQQVQLVDVPNERFVFLDPPPRFTTLLSAASVAWAPDSSAAFLVDDTDIVMIDLVKSAVTRVALPTDLSARYMVIGVA